MSVTDPQGFRAAGVAAGIKASGSPDVAVVLNDGPSAAAAGVFTSNRVKAAPVLWSQQVLAGGRVRAVVLNSGGANACTGPAGFADTHHTAEHLAALLSATAAGTEGAGQDGASRAGAGADAAGADAAGADAAGEAGAAAVGAGEIAVCSTGLIGERLPVGRLLAGVDAAVTGAASDGGRAAADAIRTTDTVPKTCSLAGSGYTVGGMGKGAAMLAPALATMLVVLTTDADLSAAELDRALRGAVGRTFDRLDTDGCMSTNDTVLLLASGASGVRPDPAEFAGLVEQACADLARQMQRDAEGATKAIAIEVTGAASEADAVLVGRAIARCSLLKCAIGGADPNWGRVLAAIGTTSAIFDPDQLSVAINGVWVCKDGTGAADRDAVDLSGRDVTITADLAAGPDSATIWTTDLTEQYVYENAAYST
ncbi:MAG TPA: bifunctional ornithine acetyltransferase/N-acetylglutamate synthase [Streptosporangiaceae bacterium]|jgi:glutamate N-acetyltransferase/amino-acid N-acetyltransferase